MKLIELNPQFLKILSSGNYENVNTPQEADGIMLECPVCKKDTDKRSHSIICWKPQVPQTVFPTPGRWNFMGIDYNDLTLVNGSSSIFLQGSPCKAHFWIKNGEIIK